jgi:hypothetical protein
VIDHDNTSGDNAMQPYLWHPWSIFDELERSRYVRRRRFHGAFARRFRLADGHDADRISPHTASGELTLRLAKAAKAKPRRIELTKRLLGGDKDKKEAVS